MRKLSGSDPVAAKVHPEGVDDLATLGRNVRAARTRMRLTLDELSARIGLSKGHLSRFERGEKSLSIAALMNVSAALETSLTSLLGSDQADEPFRLVRAGQGENMDSHAQSARYSYTVLSRPRSGQLNAFKLSLAEGSERTSEAAHPGEEGCLVLKGSIEIELNGRIVKLEEGDYIQFAGTTRHRMRSLGGPASVFLVVAAE